MPKRLGEITIQEATKLCRARAHRPIRVEHYFRFRLASDPDIRVLALLYSVARMDYPGASREYRMAIFRGNKINPVADVIVSP